MFVCLSFGLLGSGPGLWARPREGWWWGWGGGHHVGQEHTGFAAPGGGSRERKYNTQFAKLFVYLKHHEAELNKGYRGCRNTVHGSEGVMDAPASLGSPGWLSHLL